MQSEHDGRADFDFFIGRWQARNRRLRERLKGSNDWEEIEGVATIRKVLGGMGNIDEITMERETGRLEGMTLRLYNPKSRQWSLYWASSADGILQPPFIGSFAEGRGEFYSQESFEGRSVFVRFICSDITETSCRWEQAFSADGGKTWEINWIAELTRLE
jgi:hypothetical protein